jgi:hypothetical protein
MLGAPAAAAHNLLPLESVRNTWAAHQRGDIGKNTFHLIARDNAA